MQVAGGCWIFLKDLSDHLLQRARIGFPFEFDECASDASIEITRSQDQRPVQRCRHRPEFANFLITEGDLLENQKIARIKSESSLQASVGFLPTALASVHVTG